MANVICETWDITPETHWACGRPMAAYRGSYPMGFLRRLDEKIGLIALGEQEKPKKVLTLFCGVSDFGDTIDINPEVKPTFLADCRKTFPIKSNVYDIIIADTPYDSQNINYSSKLYKKSKVKPYSFTKEAVRVCIPGGLICILHQLVYKTLLDTKRYAIIPITTGPNQRIRVLNIFQKYPQLQKQL